MIRATSIFALSLLSISGSAHASQLADYFQTWNADPAHSAATCGSQSAMGLAPIDGATDQIFFMFNTSNASVEFDYTLGQHPSGLSKGIEDVGIRGSTFTVREETKNLFGSVKVHTETDYQIDPTTGALTVTTIDYDNKGAKEACAYVLARPELFGKIVIGANLVIDGATAASCQFDANGQCVVSGYREVETLGAEGSWTQKITKGLPGDQIVIQRKSALLNNGTDFTVTYPIETIDPLPGDPAIDMTHNYPMGSQPYYDASFSFDKTGASLVYVYGAP